MSYAFANYFSSLHYLQKFFRVSVEAGLLSNLYSVAYKLQSMHKYVNNFNINISCFDIVISEV